MRVARIAAVIFVLFHTSAGAQVVADTITCQQAIDYYAQNGRIQKQVGTQLLSIYDGVPASRRTNLRCSYAVIPFKTLDNPRCPVAYKCQPGFHGGR